MKKILYFILFVSILCLLFYIYNELRLYREDRKLELALKIQEEYISDVVQKMKVSLMNPNYFTDERKRIIATAPRTTSVTFANVKEKRNKLITEVFGKDGYPTGIAKFIKEDSFKNYKCKILDTGGCFFDNNSEYILLYHAGHDTNALTAYSDSALILYALDRKYDVLVMNMPSGDHSRFSRFENPLSYFIKPVVLSLNYALSLKKYKIITMAGLSGGGWTTSVCAALDERIDKSFPVAGTWPKYLRYKSYRNNSLGDYEQTLPGVTLNYFDLYALATTNGRVQTQIFNRFDPSCFEGDWALEYLEYMKKVASELHGVFDIVITDSRKHEISDTVFDIILPSLE